MIASVFGQELAERVAGLKRAAVPKRPIRGT